MVYLEVNEGGRWTLAGQYHSAEQAVPIAADYRRRGVRARITREGTEVIEEGTFTGMTADEVLRARDSFNRLV